jgi:hypothetical protein
MRILRKKWLEKRINITVKLVEIIKINGEYKQSCGSQPLHTAFGGSIRINNGGFYVFG